VNTPGEPMPMSSTKLMVRVPDADVELVHPVRVGDLEVAVVGCVDADAYPAERDLLSGHRRTGVVVERRLETVRQHRGPRRQVDGGGREHVEHFRG
jgi:hypothetical protein